jgi:lycopene cyclase domain-containing protein
MRHLVYAAILAGCLLATLPLELVMRVRVYARWRRLALTVAPVVVLFGGWDVVAINQHTWRYEQRYLLGATLPGRLPLEELLFFVVVPICSVLTLEAVRRRRPDWTVGDESESQAT